MEEEWTYFWLTEVAKGWEVKGIKQIESPIIDIFFGQTTHFKTTFKVFFQLNLKKLFKNNCFCQFRGEKDINNNWKERLRSMTIKSCNVEWPKENVYLNSWDK